MKILHIGQLIGGLDIYIRNSVTYADKSFDFVIISGKSDNNQPIVRNGEIVKEYKISLYRSLNPFKDIRGLMQILKIIRREKPDVIHCHSAKGGFIGRIAGCITGVKTYYTPHAFSFLSTQNKFKKIFFLCLEKMVRLNSYLLACSESERKLGVEVVHYKKERAFAWNNSVPDISTIKEPKEPSSFPYICYVGRPSYQKNTFFLVNVIKEVHKIHPNVRFYLLGVGYYSPDLEKMNKLIADYKLSEVINLLPWLSHDETLEYMKNAMFYLTVSRYEGLPLAVIEAMSLSKAIIASDVLGNKDCVKDGYNGYLLPLEENLFVDRINSLIKNEVELGILGNNSRKSFERDFFIENRIKYLEDFYKRFSS